MSLAHLLLVDDEQQILRALRPALSAAGYEVATAETGGEALAYLASEPCDVVILDLGLPDMDGKEVIARIREWSEAPILVLSARDLEHEKIAALDQGADDFINKPIRLADFLSRINLHRRLQIKRRNPEKGISREKLQRVLAFLKQKGIPVEINEVSLECEMSYTTAHRYLDYLARSGVVTADEIPRHGKLGRPTHAYSFRGLSIPDLPAE